MLERLSLGFGFLEEMTLNQSVFNDGDNLIADNNNDRDDNIDHDVKETILTINC